MFEPNVPIVDFDRIPSLGELLRDRARRGPDRPYLTVEGRTYTFGELDERSDALASGLSALGVKAGDRVAWLSLNRGEVVELFFAIAKIGAIEVPLNAFLKGTFLSYQIQHSQASVVVADGPGMESIAAVLDDLPDVRTFVRLAPPSEPSAGIPEDRVVDFGAVVQPGQRPVTAVLPTDTLAIMYTSGTTGVSKGCVLNHGYFVRDALAFGKGLGLSSDDTIYTTLPLFHMAALVSTLLSALVWEIPAVIDATFSASGYFSRACETEATVGVAVGAMVNALLAAPASERDRDHQVRAMVVIPLAAQLQLAFEERFGLSVWSEIYGQTECIPVTCSPRLGERDREGAGRPMDDLEVALVDDQERPVPDGEIGEIVVRPRTPFAMFSGYWNLPEDTLTAFRGLWYHTGDLGRLLPSGQIAFVDRKKDAMRRRGENISSMEVEAVIVRHEKIADVAVHAVPSPLGEDDVKACVILQPGQSVTPEELFEFLCAQLPFYMIPRYVEVFDELPRTSVGKVRKHVLRGRPIDDRVWDFEALGLTLAADKRRGAVSTRQSSPTA